MCFKGSVGGGFWPGLFHRSINKGLEVGIKCQTSVNVRKGIGIRQWRSGLWVWTARVPRFILVNLSNATGCTSTTAGTVAVMLGKEFAALRAGFDEVFLSIAGVSQASNIDCLEAALSVPGPDLDAVETVLRDNAMAASADAYRTLLQAKDDALDPLPCPTCGGVMKRPKTFTTRLGKMRVDRSYCRCSGCGKGLYPLDACCFSQ